jgi:hypothetical protein
MQQRGAVQGVEKYESLSNRIEILFDYFFYSNYMSEAINRRDIKCRNIRENKEN